MSRIVARRECRHCGGWYDDARPREAPQGYCSRLCHEADVQPRGRPRNIFKRRRLVVVAIWETRESEARRTDSATPKADSDLAATSTPESLTGTPAHHPESGA